MEKRYYFVIYGTDITSNKPAKWCSACLYENKETAKESMEHTIKELSHWVRINTKKIIEITY